MQREELNKLKIPDSPGIYFFRGPRSASHKSSRGKKGILYIGKAASLRDRVRSYFAADLVKGRGARIVGMVELATSLEWTTTDSVLEALILEANLIKEKQPPYNVDEKDNKSFNYLVITKEDFPRILVVRGRELFTPLKPARPNGRSGGAGSWKLKAVSGPFPSGLKEALKIIRRIFPYRDTCIPCMDIIDNRRFAQMERRLTQIPQPSHQRTSASYPRTSANCKPCFNRQIGLCPGVCSGEMSKAEYTERVAHINELFSGNFKGLKRNLVRTMKEAAKKEEFEKAAVLRRQVEAFDHIRDVSLIKDEHRIAPGGGTRIEAYDVAHTGGDETVAVMTVVAGGEPIKSAYRKFKIHSAKNDDVAALKEALSRRLVHAEWPLPRVFVVDGGKAQLNAARSVLKEAGVGIALVGVVKNERHQPERLIGDERAIAAHQKDILLANAEAHRFAITWHKKRRQRNLLG